MRVFVTPLTAGELTITGDEHHYLHRVRRARPGDAIELVDGAGMRARAVIERITGDATIVRAEAPSAVVAAPPHIRVLLPLIKGDRMDTCLEKLVEVGADAIVLWPAARAVVRLEADRREARVAKYRSALQAAARQCGRAAVPTVTAVDSLHAAIAMLPAGARLVLDPGADRATMPTAGDVTIVSGPEGGFAPDELDDLAAAGFGAMGLGPRVLRAETAPVVAVALIRAATGS
ncbi:MAG: 16S rRNA (uracil(1498)-N(3))-methyltransferase [Deltaproteobacteria bacterium]|nr:16S rRNA (uracil(1498)-N(3))-methyltransferase [Deltaproteobacteria bacterium]